MLYVHHEIAFRPFGSQAATADIAGRRAERAMCQLCTTRFPGRPSGLKLEMRLGKAPARSRLSQSFLRAKRDGSRQKHWQLVRHMEFASEAVATKRSTSSTVVAKEVTKRTSRISAWF